MMSTRLGLSFEIAPPPPSHPNRTDIACFVGSAARRGPASPDDRLPEVLARWLAAHGFVRLNGIEVRQLRPDLSDASRFAARLASQADTNERDALAALFAAADHTKLATLLQACRTLSPVAAATVEDLRRRGFYPGGLLGTDELAAWTRVQRLHNLPVAIRSFEEFEALFDWSSRGVMDRVVRTGDPVVVTPLGVAVRAFFAEGGQHCYVIRTDDPSALFESAAARFSILTGSGSDASPLDMQLRGIRPRFSRGVLAAVLGEPAPVSTDASEWRGIEHVFGLSDVSFLCLPDLVDACAQAIPAVVPPDDVLAVAERFHECVEEAAPDTLPAGRRLPLPRVTSPGLECWRALVEQTAAILDNGGRPFNRRDVQIIASLPLSGAGRAMPTGDDWLEWMSARDGWIDCERVQVGYPWLVTRDSADCQGGAEAPEGTLLGVLARSALQRGSFRLAAYQPVTRYVGAEPALSWTRATREDIATAFGLMTFGERVCLIGPTPRGPQLLSDVTLARDAMLRPGSIRRLFNVVVHAARDIGEEGMFEPNGEGLWARVRTRLEDLGRELLAAGALSTDAGAEAFTVRCGRETMTQSDLDAGRLIAEVEMSPAQPVTRIVVVLSLRDSRPLLDIRKAA